MDDPRDLLDLYRGTPLTSRNASSRTSIWQNLLERLAVAGLRLQAAQIARGSWERVRAQYASVEPLACKLGKRSQTFEIARAECGARLDLDSDDPARPLLYDSFIRFPLPVLTGPSEYSVNPFQG